MSDSPEEEINRLCQNNCARVRLSLATLAAVMLTILLACVLSNQEAKRSTVPIGAIFAFKGNATHLKQEGWAVCDGTTPAQQGIADAVLTGPTPKLPYTHSLQRRTDRDPVYVGCYTSESSFVSISSKPMMNHHGGESYYDSLHTAKQSGQRYFAMVRSGDYGYMFTFDILRAPQNQITGGGCDQPCKDAPNKRCGCADRACEWREMDPADPARLRRWAVYDLGEDKLHTWPPVSENNLDIVYIVVVK